MKPFLRHIETVINLGLLGEEVDIYVDYYIAHETGQHGDTAYVDVQKVVASIYNGKEAVKHDITNLIDPVKIAEVVERELNGKEYCDTGSA